MPSHKAVIAAALLAAIAGGVASLSVELTITTKLAGTELGQRALGQYRRRVRYCLRSARAG